MKKTYLLAGSLLLAMGIQAQSDSAKYLDEVIVSASKRPVKQSETGKVVTVISADQIKRMAGKTLPEILNTAAGLTINGADNTPGTIAVPYLRGASSYQTLIVVDGVPLYDPGSIGSEFDLNIFDISQIERIEILKGAQSTLYGSDAMAGVIHIITKQASDKPLKFNADLSAGSFETYKAAISLSGKVKKHSYQIAYSRFNTGGISSAWDSTGNKQFDKDGFNRDAVQVKWGVDLSEKTKLQLFGKYSQIDGDLDAGAFTDELDYTFKHENTVAGLDLQHNYRGGFVKFLYNYNRYERNYEDDSTHIGSYATYQKRAYTGISHYAELYTNWKPIDQIEILAGADFRSNASDQSSIYLPSFGDTPPLHRDSVNTQQYSGYASIHVHASKGFHLEAGSRWNHHSTYGTNFTSSINPFYLFDNGVKIYGNVSSGYHVPSLYQLYSEYGNLDLKPENSLSFEAGVQYTGAAMQARLTGFRRLGEQVILFYSDPVTYASRYINGDKQKDYGIEAEVHVPVTDKLSATANYTLVDGKITTAAAGKDSSYFNLYKRPKNTINLVINYEPIKNVTTSLLLKAVSKAYEPQYQKDPFELDGYYTLGFSGAYQINEVAGIYVNLQNMTDQEYFVTRGYTTKGFNFMAGVKLTL